MAFGWTPPVLVDMDKPQRHVLRTQVAVGEQPTMPGLCRSTASSAFEVHRQISLR
jgi:hypothetical protein